MLEFLVRKYDHKLRRGTTHLWQPGKEISRSVWDIAWQEGREDDCKGIIYSEAILDDHLFLGLNNGHIIEMKRDGTVVQRYGPRSAATGHNECEDRIRIKEVKI